MLIATWNVNGLRARMDYVLHWLQQRRPDVLALQELKMPDEIFPHQSFAEAGYQALAHGQKSWNGVALLSRAPLQEVQRGLPGQAEFGARLLAARSGEFSVTSLYCPNGKHTEHPDYKRKLAWFESLAAHVGTAAAAEDAPPEILCGDFNIVPAPADGWNEAENAGGIFHTQAERARMQALAAAGWHDLFRAKHPQEQAFTWWDYRGGAFHRGRGLRIDLLLGNAAARKRTRKVWVERDFRKKQQGLTPSDHAPVCAELM